MYCPNCGGALPDDAKFCANCGSSVAPNNVPVAQNPVLQAQPVPQPQVTNVHNVNVTVQKNSLGTAGFVLAILAVVFCWVPILDWILWIVGAVLSIIGLFRQPKGLAIAGTIISFIGIILLILLVVVLGVVGAGATMALL